MLEAIQFSSFGEFIAMGGYGFNVWSVYAVFFIFVLANLIGPLRKHKQLLAELRRSSALHNANPSGANATSHQPSTTNTGENP